METISTETKAGSVPFVQLKTPTTHKRSHASNIGITEVKTGKQLKQFLELPQHLYTDTSSPYVMPLEMHMKMMMGKLGTPQKHFFLAEVNGKPVARLGVKTHTSGGHERLHFGFFECSEKYPEAAKLLVEHAHKMYPHLEMMGPFHFRQEDPYIGVLVQGFQYDPYFLMPFNPPSYDVMLKDSGMEGAMDLFTYDLRRSEGLPPLVLENSKKCHEKLNLTMRTLNPKKLREEARIIAEIFNEALADNWGFEEFLEAQIDEMVTMLKLFIDHRVVAFAQVDGKDIGCLLMIPNYNHLIKPSKGKLGPGLILRYLNRAKTTHTIRGYALGVLKKYQGMGVGSALTDEMFKIGAVCGYEEAEVSWVLANNSPMNELAKAMGGKQNKVYRIYSRKPLSNALHN